MLVLTRRPGESIVVGDDITITVLGIKGKQIKLGIEVPDDLPVYREEVVQRVRQQNRLAVNVRKEDLLTVTGLWKNRK